MPAVHGWRNLLSISLSPPIPALQFLILYIFRHLRSQRLQSFLVPVDLIVIPSLIAFVKYPPPVGTVVGLKGRASRSCGLILVHIMGRIRHSSCGGVVISGKDGEHFHVLFLLGTIQFHDLQGKLGAQIISIQDTRIFSFIAAFLLQFQSSKFHARSIQTVKINAHSPLSLPLPLPSNFIYMQLPEHPLLPPKNGV